MFVALFLQWFYTFTRQSRTSTESGLSKGCESVIRQLPG